MDPLAAADALHQVEDLAGAFLAYGGDAGGDVDAAFDDAVEQAGYDYGFAGLTPSVASIDADRVSVAADDPLTRARALLLAARALRSGELEPGRAYALPICADSTYKRRRTRIVFTDPALEIAETAGALHHVPESVEAAVRGALLDSGTALEPDELLESVVVGTARHRYKPVVTGFKGKSVAEHAVLDPTTGTLISTGHKTAGDARRAAVTLAKEGPVAGSATGLLEVVKVIRREGPHPFFTIARTRVASRVVVKAVFGTVKNPAKVKTIGWLFYGYVPDPADADASEPGAPEPGASDEDHGLATGAESEPEASAAASE